MPHVVTDNCNSCRFTDCVTVCPVACIHGDEERVYINPETCVDCAACVSACPVHAIEEDFDLPPEKEVWIAINAEKAASLPVIRSKQTPLPTAEERRQQLMN